MERDEAVIFLDSSILISCGRAENTRFQALAREAHQRDTSFRVSPQVYAEVAGDSVPGEYTPDDSAVEEAVQDGWIKVTGSPSYSDPDVSNVMDQAQNFIASATDRSEDIIEKADTEIVGIALETLLDGTADQIIVVTNDIPLGEAVESLLPQYGFDDEQALWFLGRELAEEIAEDFVSEFD
jgi:hypothetical protein